MCSTNVLVRNKVGVSMHDYIADCVRSDKDFMEAIYRGLVQCKEGRVQPWSEIKKELGID